MRLAGECPVKHILDGYFRSSTDIKMRNCINLTTQLHNNCTLNCMTCTPLRLGVQARPVSNASCYNYGLTGKFRPGRDRHWSPMNGWLILKSGHSECDGQPRTHCRQSSMFFEKNSGFAKNGDSPQMFFRHGEVANLATNALCLPTIFTSHKG